MYNQKVRNLLKKISKQDAIILPTQKKHSVSGRDMQIDLFVDSERVSFQVYGDAYLLALVKFLQLELENAFQDNTSLELDVEILVNSFAIPEKKYTNITLILELLEKVYAK